MVNKLKKILSKRNLKIIGIVILSIIIIFLFILLIKKISSNVRENNIKDKTWLEKHISISSDCDEMGNNIKCIKTKDYVDIFNQNYQKVVEEKINEELKNNKYTFENPLIIYNPYGTNRLSVNVYFSDEKEDLSYTVSSYDTEDFTRNLVKNDENYYQLIGLVASNRNTVEITSGDNTYKFTIDLRNIEIKSQITLDVTENGETSELEDGLYAILGNDSDEDDYVALYDNNGVIRGYIPIIGYRAHALLFKDNKMYLSISQTKIAEIDNMGMITNIYKTGKYYLHHDYTFDDDGNLLVLANNTEKNTEEDCIIKINLKTKEVTEVIDFETIFESYVKTCKLDTTSTRDEGEDGLDWLHLNSIEYVSGDVILSSRETSSIIRVNDIETNPTIKYILSDKEIWADTEFSSYVYNKIGDFKIHAGQHSVRYKESDNEDEYYLIFYNNNYGKANSKPDFDYSKIGITNNNAFNGDESYYYVYKVNEKNETFELVDSFSVEYSGIVSSVQSLDNGNILVDSGTKGVFAEYTSDHKLIKKFTVKLNKYMAYRVLKYDLKGYLFE